MSRFFWPFNINGLKGAMGIRKENLGFGLGGVGFGFIGYGQGLTQIQPIISLPFVYLGILIFFIAIFLDVIRVVKEENGRNYKNVFEAIKEVSGRGPSVSLNKNASLLQILTPLIILISMTLVLVIYYPSETQGVMFPKWGVVCFFAFPFGYGLACLFNVIKITYPH